ncbi:hypothetical protein CCP3SC15_1610008 [Gammaproteobacteria bacterium]
MAIIYIGLFILIYLPAVTFTLVFVDWLHDDSRKRRTERIESSWDDETREWVKMHRLERK